MEATYRYEVRDNTTVYYAGADAWRAVDAYRGRMAGIGDGTDNQRKYLTETGLKIGRNDGTVYQPTKSMSGPTLHHTLKAARISWAAETLMRDF